MFGSTPSKQAQPFEDDEEEQQKEAASASAAAASSKPSRHSAGGSALLFAPPRPSGASPASSWDLPADALNGGSEVARAVVSLYMQTAGQSMQLKFEQCLLLLVKQAPFTYEFKVVGRDKVLIAQPLLPSLTFYFKPSTHTLVWNMQLGGTVHALVVCFASDEDEANLKQYWSLSYMEAGQQSSAATKLAEGDQTWAIRASEAGEDEDEPMEDAMQYDEEDGAKAQSTRNMPVSTYESDDDAPASSIRVGGAAASAAAAASSGGLSSGGDHNDNLAVGQLLNRTFVNRGTQIGVFKHGNAGALEYVNNVPIVRDMNKEAFAPSEMMLYDQDTKLLLLNPNKKGQVYEMDLEYGKVVQEYNAGDAVPDIRTLAQKSKYAERTSEAVVLGVNSNTVFSLDPRQQGRNKLAEHKAYKTNNKFSTLATTAAGDVAVGAEDGQIRLYNSISKVAKTCLPGLGDSITGMDVTADGSYVLATTPHYLLVIPTAVEGQAKSGFAQSITAKADAPIKLVLDPSDMVHYNITELNFTPAHFNMGDGQEQFISTSTGPYIITWNFSKIKSGKRFHYKIKRCDSTVVADQFLYNHDDKLVVTLPDNVYMQHMKSKK